MRRCCVIGGNGFIGEHLVNELVINSREVTIVDREENRNINTNENIKYIQGDYTDKKILYKILENIDEVILLAHLTMPKSDFSDPALDLKSNLLPILNFLEIAVNFPIKKIIFVSSGGTVYGNAIKIPISENHPTNPISPYGITKLVIEKYMLMYQLLEALPVICVRPANVYGERQKPFTGQGFVATAIASVIEGKDVIVFGKEGTVRDYIHVSDVVSGIIAAMEKGEVGSCYNIGCAKGYNNLEVLDEIFLHANSVNLKGNVLTLTSRKTDVPINILDSSKLMNDTGWVTSIDLKSGIKKTWDWFINQSMSK